MKGPGSLLRGNTGRAPTGSPVGKESWAQADRGAFRVELFAMAYDVSSEIVAR